jgi:hypothetical protein
MTTSSKGSVAAGGAPTTTNEEEEMTRLIRSSLIEFIVKHCSSSSVAPPDATDHTTKTQHVVK